MDDWAFWVPLSVMLAVCIGIIIWFAIVGQHPDRPANNYFI